MAAHSSFYRAIHGYEAPTFEEILRLCQDFGLVSEYRDDLHGVSLRAVNQHFELTVDEAEVLMQGLLLGYFYQHSRDDLSLAQWAQ